MKISLSLLSPGASCLALCLCAPVGLAGAAPAGNTLAEILSGATANRATPNSPPLKQPEAVAKPATAIKSADTAPVAKPVVAPGKAPEPVAIPVEPAAAGAAYSGIYEKNMFDPKRQPWVEKVETPAPSIAPLTSADADVYGVIMFGDYKKAIIKLGPGFKFAPQPKGKAVPRPFVTLGVGESLGPYQVVEISDKNVVFEGGGGRFPLAYTHKKGDRPAGAPVTPMAQAPVQLAAPVPTIVAGIEPIVAAAAQPQAAPAPVAPASFGGEGATPAGQAAAPQAAPTAQPESPSQPAAAPVQGMTLLEAIQAARASQQAGAAPPPNPFVKK